MTGIFAFAGGASRAAALVDQKAFVASVSLGWLALIAFANVRGLAVGKWVQNIGGLGAFLSVGLVLVAAVAAWASGVSVRAPRLTHVSWEMTTSFAVMCNALVGIELASTMGDEIRDSARDLAPAIAVAGLVSIASYLLVTGAVLMLVPVDQLGVIQGVMQAVTAGAHSANIGWIVIPLAIVMGLATGGAASAWFAGSSRVPFVAGLTSALPVALGRVHPRWRSPHVALITCALLAGVFTILSLAGSTVAGARRWRGRSLHDDYRARRGVPANVRRAERHALRNETDRRRRRADGARMVPLPADAAQGAGAAGMTDAAASIQDNTHGTR